MPLPTKMEEELNMFLIYTNQEFSSLIFIKF